MNDPFDYASSAGNGFKKLLTGLEEAESAILGKKDSDNKQRIKKIILCAGAAVALIVILIAFRKRS